MKTLKLLVFALIALTTVFTACKKDDEKPATAAQRVLGKWTIKNFGYKLTEDGQVLLDIEEPGKVGDFIEFNSNKSYVSSIDGDVDSGTYEVLNETAMTMKDSDGITSTVTIEKLEGKELKMTKSSSEVEDGITYREVYKLDLMK